MRVGLVARADKTGLGTQTHNFWANIHPDQTLVVDLSHCSGQRPNMAMYSGDPNVRGWANRTYPSIDPVPDEVVEKFLDKVDVVFSCETFYNSWFLQRAREKGVRTVLQPNYEFLEWLLHPSLSEPDVFALPSTWHEAEIRAALPGRDIRVVPVPIDRLRLPFKLRIGMETILHTAGTPAMEDRNGSLLLIEAMRHVRTPVKALILTQKELGAPYVPANVSIRRANVENYWDMYEEGDCYVIPRKFGGLCLPMNEALAVGMPVLSTDISPQGEFLPPDLLVPAPQRRQIMTRAMIGVHEADPVALAARIDWLYEHPFRFTELSTWAGEWGDAHSWEALRPLYDAVLSGTEPSDLQFFSKSV